MASGDDAEASRLRVHPFPDHSVASFWGQVHVPDDVAGRRHDAVGEGVGRVEGTLTALDEGGGVFLLLCRSRHPFTQVRLRCQERRLEPGYEIPGEPLQTSDVPERVRVAEHAAHRDPARVPETSALPVRSFR